MPTEVQGTTSESPEAFNIKVYMQLIHQTPFSNIVCAAPFKAIFSGY